MFVDFVAERNPYEKEMKILQELPYHNRPFSARNWGNQRHELCSYPSKIKPAIAYHLVTLFSKPGDVVLDPFSGVGTIPFEACLNGRVGIGNDLSPFAYNVTNAKVHKIDPSLVKAELRILGDLILNELEIDLPECEAATFYHPHTYREILIAKTYFQSVDITPERSFVFACLLHILHGNRPYALSRRSHNVIPIPPKGEFVYKSLMKSLSEKVSRMLKVQMPSGFKEGSAFNDDACNLSLDNESVAKVITSPPFLGTTEFLRQNRIRLWMCGWDNGMVNSMKEQSNFLEYRGLTQYPMLFDEFQRILKDDGIVVMHLGIYKGKDMAMSLIPIAEKAGFRQIGLMHEDSTHLESHGRTDRGGTHTHQFLILKKE